MKVHAGGILRARGWKADAALMGGGVLMDLGIHYVRALRLIMGEPDQVLATRAMQIDTKMAGEDSAQVLFKSPYGWEAHFLLNWAGPRGHSPDIIVSGDRGVLHLWPGRGYYDYMPAEEPEWMRFVPYIRPRWLAERLERPERLQQRRRIESEDTLGYLTEVREFLAAVGEKRAPVSDPRDGVRDLEVVLRAYESMNSGRWVEVPG
jgi:predicted dehydrogenase